MTNIKPPPAEVGAPSLGVAAPPKPKERGIRPGGPDYGPGGPPTLGIKQEDKSDIKQ